MYVPFTSRNFAAVAAERHVPYFFQAVFVGSRACAANHYVIAEKCPSRAVKRNNCSFCDKSTIFTKSLPFNMTIYIAYGGISEINPHCRKFKISQVSL